MSGAPPPGPGLETLAGAEVRLYVGEKDGTWISSARQMEEALESLGIDAELEVLPGEGHFLGSLAGDALIRRMETLRRRD